MLNAPVLTERVRPYQSVGAFGPRHFDKYVWYVPIPLFDPADGRHMRLAELGGEAEGLAASVELPARTGFQQARRRIRDALAASPIGQEVEQIVAEIIQPRKSDRQRD